MHTGRRLVLVERLQRSKIMGLFHKQWPPEPIRNYRYHGRSPKGEKNSIPTLKERKEIDINIVAL